jgi:SOS-response transcriptional repressors (RecA-mediated autopeptidases)
MAKGLTEKQRKILEYIIDFQKDNGFPPTIRELGDAFGIGSLRGVTVHLDALVRKGFMTRERTSRSIRITGPDPRDPNGTRKSENAVMLPLIRGFSNGERQLVGKISSEGQVERYIAVPEEMAAPATEDGFVIRVAATGVHGEPIIPGDLLVVRPQRQAPLGELVVVLSHGDLTVCRMDTSLQHNEAEDVVLHGDTEVIGRVVGMIRRY